MSVSQDKPFTKMILDQVAKSSGFVDRPSPNLHNQLMDEILQGVCLKKTVRLAPRQREVSGDLSSILRRRIAFELSSSSDESAGNDKSADEWNTYCDNNN